MAADVGRDVMLAEFLLDELHRREDRPLGTADAEAWRTRGHDFGELLHSGIGENRSRIRQRRLVAKQLASVGREKLAQARRQHRRGVFAAHRQHVLAGDLRLDVAAAQDGVEIALDIVRRALLDHQHGFLAAAEFDEFVLDQRIGDVEHIERDGAAAVGVGEAEIFERSHRRVLHARPAARRRRRPSRGRRSR